MKNGKAIKRVVSSVMALAVAFTMCMVATPMRVLAATGFYIYNDGTVGVGGAPEKTDIMSAGLISEGYTNDNIGTVASYDTTSSTLTIDGLQFSDLVLKNGMTLTIKGNCSIQTGGALNGTATIQMTKGATVTIDNWATISAVLTVKNGTISGNTITADANAPEAGGTTADVKVGNSVNEQGKTSADSATYKVTNTDEGKRSVTYEKPAENASGTEEVKAEVTLADSKVYKVTAIADSAFSNFGGKDKITEIKICDNVEDIGANACKDCTNLTTVTFGANVKNIGANAFSGCTALKTANLNGNIETIGNSAFEATKITKVTLGKKVKKVGRKAYYKCGSLKIITVKSTKLTKKSKVGNNAFGKINKKAKVKIKMGKKDATKYKSNTIKVFKNKKIGYVNTWKVS